MIAEELKPRFKELEEKFRRRWSKIGYSETLQDRAVERARGWLDGLVRIFDHERKPELAKEWQKANLEAAFVHSERWMDEILEALAPERAEELKRKKAELKLEEVGLG